MIHKNMRKLLSLMLSLCVILPVMGLGGITAYGSESGYIESKTQSIGELKKGDVFDLEIRLNSNGNRYISKNTKLEVEVGGATTSVPKSSVIYANDKYIALKGLTYNGRGTRVSIYLKLENEEGSFIVDDSIELDVHEKAEASGLVLDNTTIRNVVAGETQQIILTLTNKGEETKPGKMELSIKNKNSTSSGIKIKNKNHDIPSLGKNKSKDFPITLVIEENVTRGIHEMEVSIDEGTPQIVKLKVDSDFMPASLEVKASNTDGFKVGAPQDITLDIKNVGHIDAKNVKLTLETSEKVYVVDGSNVRYLDNVPTNRNTQVKVRLQVNDPSALTVPLPFKMTYIDDLGESKEESQIIYLNTTASGLSKEVNITNVKEPSGTYKPNEPFKVSFTLSAPEGAQNLEVSVNGPEGVVPTSKNLFIIDKLAAGEKRQYSVEMMATNTVKSSTYPIAIEVDPAGNIDGTTIQQYTTVTIQNPEADLGEDGNAKGKPKVIVGHYASDPVVVRAGEEFNLEIGFLNTSDIKSVHNLKANLSIVEQGEANTGSVFTPVGASNTFYISELNSGETSVQNITLYTIPSAAPKTYEVTISMEYEDEAGNSHTAEEHIGIPVEQVTEVEIAEVRTEMVQVGMPMLFSATLYNTGKTDVSNMMIHIEGEGFDVTDNKVFIGNFERGASEYYEPEITPYESGILKGMIILEYEDPTGEKFTKEQEFEMEIMEAPSMPEEEMMPEIMPEDMEVEKPSKLPIVAGILVGIGLAAVITMIVLKKRRRKLEEMDLYED